MKHSFTVLGACTLAGAFAFSLAGCGASSDKAAKTYTVSYNLNTNIEQCPDYQFLKSNYSILQYDSRTAIDITLTLNGDGTYKLFSDCYASEGGERCEIGDGSGIGSVITTDAAGAYTDDGDGTVKIDVPTALTYTVKTDTYSAQTVSVADLSMNGDDSDGVWTLEDTPAVAELVPATIFTLSDDGKIVTYARAEGETGTLMRPATAEKASAESSATAPATNETGETAGTPLLSVVSDDTATRLDFSADGTYTFVFDSYSITDQGTYTYNATDTTLTLTDANGVESTSTVDDQNVKIHYAFSQNDQLTGDYTIAITDLAALAQ